MKISLDDIQAAFFGDDVPRKNIALRKAHDEIVRLKAALTDVTKPLEYLRRHAEADGNKLSGMAYSIANDLHFVQKIAKDALELEAPSPQPNLRGEPVAWRVRVKSDDPEEWSLVPAGGGADYLDREGYECQPLYVLAPEGE